jgi:PIN domain nuclease of toxin-antitoxin system
MLNLDTHILIDAIQNELSIVERKLLSTNRWSISAIVLWEIEKLFERGRITLDIKDAEFKHTLRTVHIWPIDLVVCGALRELDFRSDPADEIIGATSIVHKVPLLTRDRKILASHLVPFPSKNA